jgi:hypothetical protein
VERVAHPGVDGRYIWKKKLKGRGWSCPTIDADGRRQAAGALLRLRPNQRIPESVACWAVDAEVPVTTYRASAGEDDTPRAARLVVYCVNATSSSFSSIKLASNMHAGVPAGWLGLESPP